MIIFFIYQKEQDARSAFSFFFLIIVQSLTSVKYFEKWIAAES